MNGPAKSSVRFDQNDLKQLLSVYLLVQRGSLEGWALVNAVVREINLRSPNRVTRLHGDPFFLELLRELFFELGFGASANRDGDQDSTRTLNIPGPIDRVADIPLFVSFVVQSFAESAKNSFVHLPKYISGEVILLLLAPTLWRSFDHMKEFIDSCLQNDRSRESETIDLFDAVAVNKELFLDDDHIRHVLRDHAPVHPNLRVPSRGQEDSKTAWLITAIDHFVHFYDRPFRFQDSSDVCNYIYASHSQGPVIMPFPLAAIGHAMANILVLSGKFPDLGTIPDELRPLIKTVAKTRNQHARANPSFMMYDGIEGYLPTVWHGWDQATEVKALVDAGLCTEDNYQDFVERLHMNLRFRENDATLECWKEIRDVLFTQVKGEILGRSASGIPSEETSESEVKKLQVFEDDATVVHGDNKYCLPDKFYGAVTFLARQHKKGNVWVSKHRIYEDGDITSSWIQATSVRKWFLNAGGEPCRFARDGLIETGKKGTCRIPLAPDLIEFVNSLEASSTG